MTNQVSYLPMMRDCLGKIKVLLNNNSCRTAVWFRPVSRACIPGGDFMGGQRFILKTENGNGTEIHGNIYYIDYDYLKTLGIPVVEGRNFSRDFPTDSALRRYHQPGSCKAAGLERDKSHRQNNCSFRTERIQGDRRCRRF